VKRKCDKVKLIYFNQEEKKNFLSLIYKDDKKDVNESVFPKYLRENIHELSNYRNIISHNSKSFIGQYDAQKAVFCGITLLMWWMKEVDKISWEEDQDTILKEVVGISNK
jgi:hypothetical protein